MTALEVGRPPTYWRRTTAVAGRGELLLGPSVERGTVGAAVIAPPGVLLRTADGSPPLTRDGWRHARWAADVRGRVLIDQTSPVASIEISLREAAETVATLCPLHLGWIEQIVVHRMRLLLGRMVAFDDQGLLVSSLDHPGAVVVQEAGAALLALVEEADRAFAAAGDSPARGTHPYTSGDWFAHVKTGLLERIAFEASHERGSAALAPPPPRSTLRRRGGRR